MHVGWGQPHGSSGAFPSPESESNKIFARNGDTVTADRGPGGPLTFKSHGSSIGRDSLAKEDWIKSRIGSKRAESV